MSFGKLNNTFTNSLPADPISSNRPRQVLGSMYSFVTPRLPSKPKILHVAKAFSEELGINTDTEEFLAIFSGKEVLPNTKPYAMCYGGHQFGHWAGQLGDGRAINLFESEIGDKTWAFQLKGAGLTPYSRTADGLAVLRSSVREHLCSEAMHALGVPTTRSLSLILTGDQVWRDMLYDGNPAYEKGAVVCRVAPSFVRFGNFEIFSARQDQASLELLVDYTIQHLFPEIKKKDVLGFFHEVANRTMKLMVEWQRVGFTHGVMNTDNMSILGLTIDYGPYGWLEGYDPSWTPNTTDRQHRRYRFGNQPRIALWNLVQLANALYPLVREAKPFEDILEKVQKGFQMDYLEMMGKKIGLSEFKTEDQFLIDDLDKVLRLTETDMTIFFRSLKNITPQMIEPLNELQDAFYVPTDLENETKVALENWLKSYQKRLAQQNLSELEKKKIMDAVNPKYVLRNYMAQLAIDQADEANYSLVEELYQLLQKPYQEQPEMDKWFQKRPEWARSKVGCSMLSCSS